MPDASSISIDQSKQFEHLARAPIVEAVIEFRARAEARWDEADISRAFKESLPDYSDWRRVSQGSFKAEFRLAPKDGEQPAGTGPAIVEHAWLGLRGEGAEGRYVATFTRDGFSLSRLAPYDSWDPFRDEEPYQGRRRSDRGGHAPALEILFLRGSRHPQCLDQPDQARMIFTVLLQMQGVRNVQPDEPLPGLFGQFTHAARLASLVKVTSRSEQKQDRHHGSVLAY
jgi:hypothetical protein